MPSISTVSINMKPKALLQLPDELLAEIVSHVLQPTHLRSLAQVCKKLCAVATEKLCHTVCIPLNEPEKLTNFLVPRHPGHRSIKNVFFLLPTYPWELGASFEAEANEMIRRTISLLAKDSLEFLRFPRQLSLELETLKAVFLQQRTLKRLLLSALADGFPGSEVPIDSIAGHLESLEIPMEIGDARDLAFYKDLIRRSQKLEHLAIRCSDYHEVPENGTATRPELGDESQTVFETLFEGCAMLEPLLLNELYLQDLSLASSSSTWMKVFRFDVLQYLQIYGCTAREEFFGALAHVFRNTTPRLQGFVFDSNRGLIEVVKSLEDCLKCFSGLKYLTVRMHCKQPEFDMACLRNHLSTIEDLLVELSGYGRQWTITEKGATLLGTSAPQLRQLAMVLPGMPPGKVPYVNWATLGDTLDRIASIPQLEILRILETPPAMPGSKEALEHEAYRAFVDQFAGTVMKRIAETRRSMTPKFKLLCIGPSDETLKVDCYCYLPGVRQNDQGDQEIIATPIDYKLVRYIHPHWDTISLEGDMDAGLGIGGYGYQTNI